VFGPLVKKFKKEEERLFDLPYIVTHPLLASICRRHAELMETARALPAGSKERNAIERRISVLEQYRLPKPLPQQQQVTPVLNDWGAVIGEKTSLRRRLKTIHRGRPEEHRIKVRAAFEEKIAHPERTWRDLAQQFGFPNQQHLERQTRLLKTVLQKEGIPIPTATDYQVAKEAFEHGLDQLHSTPPPE
jgi:hypothetical protein